MPDEVKNILNIMLKENILGPDHLTFHGERGWGWKILKNKFLQYH